MFRKGTFEGRAVRLTSPTYFDAPVNLMPAHHYLGKVSVRGSL